jgi:CRP-like cAMP-binding protein
MIRRRVDAKMRRLAEVPLFGSFSPGDLQRLARAADVVDVPAGEKLVVEGRMAHEFFVILGGVAEVSRNGSRVTLLEAGDCFGEIALLDGRPRSATVSARTDMRVAVVERRQFRSLVCDQPAFATALLSYMASRLRSADLKAAISA